MHPDFQSVVLKDPNSNGQKQDVKLLLNFKMQLTESGTIPDLKRQELPNVTFFDICKE